VANEWSDDELRVSVVADLHALYDASLPKVTSSGIVKFDSAVAPHYQQLVGARVSMTI
jgi:hypothetical protein